MHRTVLNMARSMIFACNMPPYSWGDAVEYATYILNWIPTSANEKRASPYEVLTEVAPDLRDIVVLGSTCDVRRDPGKNSLAQRSEEGQIIGRSDETKGYRVYLSKSNVVITMQHVKNIAAITAEQNKRLLRGVSDPVASGDREITTSTRASSGQSHQVAVGSCATARPKEKNKMWQRQALVTRSAAKRAGGTVQMEEPSAISDVINLAYEKDPIN